MDTKNESRNKNILIGALIAVVLIMGVGYAAFAQQLTINGNAEITSTWDVHIKSITPGTKEAGTLVGTAKDVAHTVDSATSATFSTELVSPGDSITYTVVVENSGNIAAKVADAGVTFTEGANKDAIKYSYDGIAPGTKVAADGGTATFTVKVEYLDSVTSQPADAQKTNTLKMLLNFDQDK